MAEHSHERQLERDVADETGRGADAELSGSSGSASRDMSDEEIRIRAHEIYLRRGGTEGDEIADWLAAERELRGQSASRRSDEDTSSADARM